ncbi:MAG TPA: CDP-glucose 4,6-dehydratase [Balneolaceae bacterium]|nr:CDP-glucose 4,6-dehydratase [Balneolaceae bacterium]|tara:strand:+ start:242210 stop:243304 length:1095 start_codon:yes stop_codon:yes gene_type:complete
MESLVTNPDFWNKKRVFLTGHTGFKGSWLSIWLTEMGAIVTGYAKDIPTKPSLFKAAGLSSKLNHIEGDVRDFKYLKECMLNADPHIIIHMAAQPLVRYSYEHPLETYETNVMGTVNLLEAARVLPSLRSVVIVTTDKCYENREWEIGYKETDQMGGYDPYSSSKGAAELVVSAYNRSYFQHTEVMVTSARAGNVIGGGDWAEDRLVPDVILSLTENSRVPIRNPLATRPWQHVLEPLSGYLLLAEKGFYGQDIRGGWNFGPEIEDARNVQWVAETIGDIWGINDVWFKCGDEHPHEANFLKLDITKAKEQLNWYPNWDARKALEMTTGWYKDFYNNRNEDPQVIYNRCVEDINHYATIYANIH